MSGDVPKYICGSCRKLFERPVAHRPGSSRLELLLFIFGIVPGLVYRMLRSRQGVHIGCPYCRGALIVKTASERGRKLLRELRASQTTTTSEARSDAQ